MVEFEGLLVPARKRKNEESEKHATHVSKKARKTKGVEVVFNEKAHRDFVTGFRKRKQQRRMEAQQQLKDLGRKQRLSTRAERRAKLKEELGLDDNWGVSSDEVTPAKAAQPGAGGGKATEVAVYEGQGMLTTVTTAPLELYSSDPDSEEEEEQGQGKEAGQGAAAAHEPNVQLNASKKKAAPVEKSKKQKKGHQQKSCAGKPRSKHKGGGGKADKRKDKHNKKGKAGGRR